MATRLIQCWDAFIIIVATITFNWSLSLISFIKPSPILIAGLVDKEYSTSYNNSNNNTTIVCCVYWSCNWYLNYQDILLQIIEFNKKINDRVVIIIWKWYSLRDEYFIIILLMNNNNYLCVKIISKGYLDS